MGNAEYVYIVKGGYHYEGFTILGVYRNEDDAELARKEAIETDRYDYVEIETHKLN